MFKQITSVLVAVLMLFTAPSAMLSTALAADLPTAHNPQSKYRIRYDDLEYLFGAVVLDTGMSDRRKTGRNSLRETSTRIRHGNYSITAYEGNRVAFSQFGKEQRQSLFAMRQDLEAVASIIPLEEFSRMEQLAYWLNLHNIAVLVEVADAYPVKKVKFLREGRRAVWDNKTMSIAGVPTSIQDIEDHVVANWNDPLVLYGLFTGAVGGPNLRDHAFTSENVVTALQANAIEFVNSLRGFRLWSGRGRVSEHYELGRRYFRNSEAIKSHMMMYARPEVRAELSRASSIKIDNYDWGIADIKNGDFYEGSSFNTSAGALAWFVEVPAPGANVNAYGATDAFASDPFFNKANIGAISPQTRALLRAVKTRNERRENEGIVTVEEFIAEEGGRIIRDKLEGEQDETSNDG